MSDCGNCSSGGGPFAEGKDLVEFVWHAHGGEIRNAALPDKGLPARCQGCGAAFVMKTFVATCPACGGVHAVSPPRCHDPANIQFAGKGYQLPKD